MNSYSHLPKLSEIEEYFNSLDHYPEGIVVDGTIISSEGIERLVKAEIIILKAHSGNKGYWPYYDRLVKIYEKVKEIKNTI